MSDKVEKKDKALRWPIGIIVGTIAIIALSVGTIIVALENPVQMDNDFNSEYRNIDKNINDIVAANVAFKKKYKLSYMAYPLKAKASRIAYSVMTQDDRPVVDAKIDAVLTRPNEVQNDIKLNFKSVGKGIYEADLVDLPLLGRWNLYASVTVGTEKGYLRLKLDTRYPKDILPFETVLPMN
jgi:hypothetical protein